MEPKESGFSVHGLNKFYSFSREVMETRIPLLHTAERRVTKGRGRGPHAPASAGNRPSASFPIAPLEGAGNLNSPATSLPPNPGYHSTNHQVFTQNSVQRECKKLPNLVSMQDVTKRQTEPMFAFLNIFSKERNFPLSD